MENTFPQNIVSAHNDFARELRGVLDSEGRIEGYIFMINENAAQKIYKVSMGLMESTPTVSATESVSLYSHTPQIYLSSDEDYESLLTEISKITRGDAPHTGGKRRTRRSVKSNKNFIIYFLL
jgi:hypothetical protein